MTIRKKIDIPGSSQEAKMEKLKYLFLILRPRHWIKNLFIFTPLIFGKKLFSPPSTLKAITAYCLFSLLSSSVYLINDLIDIEQDRLHQIKRLRPIPSGKVSKKQAQITAAILGLVSIALSFMLDIYFGWIAVIYFVFNLLYSKIFKKVVVIDVFCLAMFFLLRVIAGTVITKAKFSYWMILIVTLLSLFLGFNKRRQELRLLGIKSYAHRHVLSKYSLYYIDWMISVTTFLIAVIYMLYTVDTRTVAAFGTRDLFYSIPFVYYGIFRYLYLIHKVNRFGDPTDILLSDRMLQLNIILWISVCVYVIYFRL